MAQEKIYIAVRSESLSRPGDDRYVIKNRETHEVVDDNHGNGYRSPKAAHASYAFKHRHWTPKPAGEQKSTGVKKPTVTTKAQHSPTPQRKHQDVTPLLFDSQN